jgi:hypothetical protein
MKDIRCLVRWHSWRPTRNDGGDWYGECRRCGAYKDLPHDAAQTGAAAFQSYGGGPL